MKQFLAGATLLLLSAVAGAAPQTKPNVLFIAVDDLRPQTGAYGVDDIRTPNMDALAARGLLFNRAYCSEATCSPSRTSLLTGRRPDTTRVWDLVTHFRDTIPDVITLPQHFKNNGYFTQSFGKIYHGGLDDEASWSAPSPLARGGEKLNSPGVFPIDKGAKPSWAALEVDDDELPDGKVAGAAIEALQKHQSEPFFLAVGFYKPHLPFIAPKKYYDWYALEKIRLAPNDFAPKDVPEMAMTNNGELRSYSDIPKGDAPIGQAKARELIRGYYAATSYTDAQIGRVLDELDKLKLRENTIVILWGDHGWQLGEHTLWEKHTNFEVATRAPLILSVPGAAGDKTRGQKTEALVEFVDIYPTLCELAGLPLTGGLEGKSFAPLLDNPAQAGKAAAYSQFPRAWNQTRNMGRIMGYSMRTDRYRYNEWIKASDKSVVGVELYDHQNDVAENSNVAARAENKEIVAQLHQQLRVGFPALSAPGPLPKPPAPRAQKNQKTEE